MQTPTNVTVMRGAGKVMDADDDEAGARYGATDFPRVGGCCALVWMLRRAGNVKLGSREGCAWGLKYGREPTSHNTVGTNLVE